MTFRPKLGAPLLSALHRETESLSTATARAVVAGLLHSGGLPPEVEARLRLGEELSPCRELDGPLVFMLGDLEICRVSQVEDSITVELSLSVPPPADFVSFPFGVSVGGSVDVVRPDPVEVDLEATVELEEGEP